MEVLIFGRSMLLFCIDVRIYLVKGNFFFYTLSEHHLKKKHSTILKLLLALTTYSGNSKFKKWKWAQRRCGWTMLGLKSDFPSISCFQTKEASINTISNARWCLREMYNWFRGLCFHDLGQPCLLSCPEQLCVNPILLGWRDKARRTTGMITPAFSL